MSGFESIVGVNPWTALFTFGNLILTFLLLKKFLFKPVKKMIDDRQKEIDDQYADADRTREEAVALQAEYRQRLDAAKSERDEIVRDATARAQKREQEIISAAKSEALSIQEKARADIALEKKKALNDMKDEISSIAVSIATKVTQKEIKEKDHEALIEEFIEGLGDKV